MAKCTHTYTCIQDQADLQAGRTFRPLHIPSLAQSPPPPRRPRWTQVIGHLAMACAYMHPTPQTN